MSYMWNEFNIKTFPAETIVFRDGVYCDNLSTIPNAPINTKFDLPVHVIYVGEIAGENKLDVWLGAENQPVIISVNVKIKKPAFLNIFIKNAGKNSKISGTVLLDNQSELNFNCDARHLYKNTAILIKNKILAGKNSVSKLSGVATVDKDCEECESDIAFVAMADAGAKIEFLPGQNIKSEPVRADHSASIYKPTDNQVFYLRGAGLGTFEVDAALKEAFLSE
ncbi:MAG: SufD family Fe-S cluster assembly protein [Alphaproteobacteria bacterium]|nr:SufD family Fe-S cluster assembly protein [Alphaproteobacteria bacterium]